MGSWPGFLLGITIAVNHSKGKQFSIQILLKMSSCLSNNRAERCRKNSAGKLFSCLSLERSSVLQAGAFRKLWDHYILCGCYCLSWVCFALDDVSILKIHQSRTGLKILLKMFLLVDLMLKWDLGSIRCSV